MPSISPQRPIARAFLPTPPPPPHRRARAWSRASRSQHPSKPLPVDVVRVRAPPAHSVALPPALSRAERRELLLRLPGLRRAKAETELGRARRRRAGAGAAHKAVALELPSDPRTPPAFPRPDDRELPRGHADHLTPGFLRSSVCDAVCVTDIRRARGPREALGAQALPIANCLRMDGLMLYIHTPAYLVPLHVSICNLNPVRTMADSPAPTYPCSYRLPSPMYLYTGLVAQPPLCLSRVACKIVRIASILQSCIISVFVTRSASSVSSDLSPELSSSSRVRALRRVCMYPQHMHPWESRSSSAVATWASGCNATTRMVSIRPDVSRAIWVGRDDS